MAHFPQTMTRINMQGFGRVKCFSGLQKPIEIKRIYAGKYSDIFKLTFFNADREVAAIDQARGINAAKIFRCAFF